MSSNAFRFLGDNKDIDCSYDILDKGRGVSQYVAYMLDRTSRIFEYENLPPTIPAYILEFYLQTGGVVCFTKANPIREQYQLKKVSKATITLDSKLDPVTVGESNNDLTATSENLYVFQGSLGGVPDIYYRPTQFIISNPVLSKSIICTIGKDCEIMKNDSSMLGLLPLFLRYSVQMVENDVSIRSAQIISRQRAIISASSDSELASANLYTQRLEEGRLSVIAEAPFLEGVKVQNASTLQSNSIIQLIELQQYLKASWYNEIGLNSNFNMKREYLSEEEIAASTDMLLPLIDDMFYCRKVAVERINVMFGTNIEVKKGSAWANKNREVSAELENKEADVEVKESQIEVDNTKSDPLKVVKDLLVELDSDEDLTNSSETREV